MQELAHISPLCWQGWDGLRGFCCLGQALVWLGDAMPCHTMPRDAVRSSQPRERQLRLLLVQDLQEAGASPRLQAGSRRVQRRCQAVEGCLACLGWHGCCCPPAPVPSHFWLSPDTSDWQWGLSSLGMRAGPLPLPAARPLARLLSPVADGKPLGYIFCITPSPCWCVGSKALMEGAFIAALWYKSAGPKPRSLQTQSDLQHRNPVRRLGPIPWNKQHFHAPRCGLRQRHT